MYFRCLAASVSLVALTACGGGSSGNAVGAASFRSLVTELGATEELLNNSAPTRADQIPTSGSAQYSGVISVFEAAGPSALDADRLTYASVGEMSVTTNFRSGKVTGTANNFYEFRNPNTQSSNQAQSAGRIGGSMTLDADIDRGLIVGGMAGRLTKTSGARTNYDMDVVGIFSGNRAQAMVGLGEGRGTTGSRSTSAGAVFSVR